MIPERAKAFLNVKNSQSVFPVRLIVLVENMLSMRARRATTLTESPRFFRKILIILLLEAALNVLKNR